MSLGLALRSPQAGGGLALLCGALPCALGGGVLSPHPSGESVDPFQLDLSVEGSLELTGRNGV